uniref:WAT1-related protein n=1 Tax=Cajanus cajan TaxID=3821 RepID=A0A151SK48_CAJCA|nr:Auxin-induced protein 5NG4 [Cajanus cajan]
MNRYVFVVYRNAIAALALAPFALIFERKIRPKITLPVFLQITALGFVEPVIDQGFTFLGMQYTSASFASAIMNAVPSVTFVLAVILRLERVNVKEVRSLAKVIGTLVTFSGALLMTLYKGPLIKLFYTPNATHHQDGSHSPEVVKHWVSGTLFLLLGCVAWSSFFILQNILWPGVLERAVPDSERPVLKPERGILVSERAVLMYWWCVNFASGMASFICKINTPIVHPERAVLVSERDVLILDQLHLGSIIGAIIIALGLYSVVWGKGKDYSDPMPSSPTSITKQMETQQLPITSSHI